MGAAGAGRAGCPNPAQRRGHSPIVLRLPARARGCLRRAHAPAGARELARPNPRAPRRRRRSPLRALPGSRRQPRAARALFAACSRGARMRCSPTGTPASSRRRTAAAGEDDRDRAAAAGPPRGRVRLAGGPATGLYARQSFNLRFGDRLAPKRPADGPLVAGRPALPPQPLAVAAPLPGRAPGRARTGEREFWLRLTDARYRRSSSPGAATIADGRSRSTTADQGWRPHRPPAGPAPSRSAAARTASCTSASCSSSASARSRSRPQRRCRSSSTTPRRDGGPRSRPSPPTRGWTWSRSGRTCASAGTTALPAGGGMSSP